MNSEGKYPFGICLSGGGSRGAAHVGVLKALEEEGLKPDVISGTSAGAIVGALYAAGNSPEDIMEFVSSSSLLQAYRLCYPTNGLTDFGYLPKKMGKLIKEDDFDKLEIPLYVGTTNIETGEMVVFNSGELLKIVQAAGSIPLVFKPVEINGQHYVDGGAMNNLPAQCIRDKCDFLLGVNVMSILPIDRKPTRGFFGMALRCVYLGIAMNSAAGREVCDLVIEPGELYNYDIFRFGKKKIQEMYDLGYKYTKEAMPDILKALAKN